MTTDSNQAKKNIVVPLFPLPTTVFYPNTPLPLHIFEPRYYSMVADALEEEREIGMILLKSGWENNYKDTPEIMNIGCVGKIARHTQLPEDKYNILLFGLHRFRIINEIEGKIYRQAQVELLEEINNQDLIEGSISIKQRLIKTTQQYLNTIPGGEDILKELSLENCTKLSELVDKVIYHFDLPANKMQEFLEQQDVQKRADSLQALIEFKKQLIQISKNMKSSKIDFSMN